MKFNIFQYLLVPTLTKLHCVNPFKTPAKPTQTEIQYFFNILKFNINSICFLRPRLGLFGGFRSGGGGDGGSGDGGSGCSGGGGMWREVAGEVVW